MWLHGAASTAVGPRKRFGIRPELLQLSDAIASAFFFFPFFAFADFLTTFLTAAWRSASYQKYLSERHHEFMVSK